MALKKSELTSWTWESTWSLRGSTGIHIVRLDERIGGEEPATASAPGGVPPAKAEEIKEQLYAKALEERYNRWLKEDLRQRHHVEVRQ